MPLLLDGQPIEQDPWTLLSDDQLLLSDQDFVAISMSRYLQLAGDGELLPDGVSVATTDDVSQLAPYIDQLALVCIEFPAYTDGRGYSHARLLRKRLGYLGELRAVGDIRADQMLFLQRLGFNAFDCLALPDQVLVKQLITRFEHNYQPSYALPMSR